MSLERLILHFNNYFSLNQQEREEVKKLFLERQVKRRQFILQQNDVCRHFHFVVSGCFKMYGVDQKGGEHNIQFAAENDWITNLGSFYSDKPSQLYIEAIEPSVILQIKKPDLLYLYINYHKFDRNFRIIIERKYIELQNRVLQNISSTAEERYKAFLEQYPNLTNRLPNTQIASYLGITPEFLSKIRKDMAREA
ncbi:MAG: cyclic nucleotide-binding protein [Adhaeribacter sp.]|nr:cyclic nucleotide-binding protein [Adhaeribacter sp.]